MSLLSDQETLEQIKSGNLQIYKKVFDEYYTGLYRYCVSMVRDEQVGEEIVQDAFVYIWEKRNVIKISTSLKSYLYSSVKNKSINYIKNELPKLRATEDLSEAMLHIQEEEEDNLQLKLRVQAAIDQLPERCKQVFLLSRYSGYTYKEIAEELDISVKTVENQMTIAFQKLRVFVSNEK